MSDELEPEIERILNMSDEEVEAELRAEGIDPEENARELQAIFEKAVRIANKRRCSICSLPRIRGCTACVWWYCKDCH